MANTATPPAEKNAMERKLDHLEALLRLFFEECNKPFLRWLADPDDEEIVNVFIEYEQEAGGLTQLLMETKIHFGNDPDDYSLRIIEDIKRQYEEIKPALAEDGIMMDWVPPSINKNEKTSAYLIRTLESFTKHHEDLITGMGLYLSPPDELDADSFSGWVKGILAQRIPPAIRFIVLDSLASPVLQEVAKEAEKSISSEPLQLDYPGMLEELAKGEGNRTGPDTEFRVLLVRLSNLAKKQDIKGAEEVARKALAVAESQNWLQMQVTVFMMMAGNYLQVADNASSLESYKSALAIARKAKEAKDPAGPKLEIICLMALATVFIVQADFASAAKVYLEVSPLAEVINEPILAMEGWRMAAYCSEKQKEFHYSVSYAIKALEQGEKIPKDQRAQSTLAFVGEGLVRVIKATQKKHRAEGLPGLDEVDEQMQELLGEKWQEHLAANAKGAGIK